MDKLVIVIFASIIIVVTSVKLPSSLMRCDRKNSDFGQCFAKAIENAVSQLNKPIKEVGLPNMEPLEIPSLVIGAGSGAVAFEQNYKNCKVYGFTKVHCSKADFNFDAKTLFMNCTIPKLTLDFAYEINGRILLLPIYGKGPGIISLNELKFLLTFNIDTYEKTNRKYFKAVESKLVMNPNLVHIKLDNLFDGNKALGDAINQVMNDNWPAVFADVKPGYEAAFGKIFRSIFNRLLAKVPASELIIGYD